jgi:hypothetical protein
MRKERHLDFEVDKLTNSIENTLTGEVFEAEIVRLSMTDESLLRDGNWQFDWLLELHQPNHEVYKLTTRENPSLIQGLVSLSDQHDHVFLHLLESADFNIGRRKLYQGVPGNLVAFACKTSFERRYDGVVVFLAKTKLIEHYKNTLGAKRIWGHRMFLDTAAAHRLVRTYFKDFDET